MVQKIHACGLALMSAHVSKIFTLQIFCYTYKDKNSMNQSLAAATAREEYGLCHGAWVQAIRHQRHGVWE
jgi:hypothetical protein